MSTENLVDAFKNIALQQDQALIGDDITKYNRLYDEMEEVELALKRRGQDQRRALTSLFEHPNAQVRLKAALATLAVAPQAARRTLQIISDCNEYPEAADARGMLRALDEGTFKPE